MTALPSQFMLSNGRSMPAIGIGTGTFKDDGEAARVKQIVLEALKIGYRHIDTAAAYGTEIAVGEAIRESGVPREEIFITTKLDQNWHDLDAIVEACDRSLRDLQIDYVPHAYHSEGPDHVKSRHSNGKPIINIALSQQYCEVWAEMESLVDSGKALAIGVSTFNILKMKRLLRSARIKPAVNQVELHPRVGQHQYLPQSNLIDFCRRNNVHVTAHQPLGGQPIDVVKINKDVPGPLKNPQVISLAGQASITAAQALLSCSLMRGISIVPKTSEEHRLKEDLILPVLDPSTFKRLSDLSEQTGHIRYLQPRDYIGFDIFDEGTDQPTDL